MSWHLVTIFGRSRIWRCKEREKKTEKERERERGKGKGKYKRSGGQKRKFEMNDDKARSIARLFG